MSAIEIDQVDPKKRRLLAVGVTAAVGSVGAAAAAVPFALSMFPSARAKAAGAPVSFDLSKVEPGQQVTIEWRGKPIWVIRRTPEMVAQLAKNDALLADPGSADSKQPEFAKNATRSKKSDILVIAGVCTHLGCSPTYRKEIGAADLGGDWPGGFFCPCHQSKFDMSGRVFKGMPAPKNLEVPPYAFVSDTELLIGEEPKSA